MILIASRAGCETAASAPEGPIRSQGARLPLGAYVSNLRSSET